jgi:hypothetical protein
MPWCPDDPNKPDRNAYIERLPDGSTAGLDPRTMDRAKLEALHEPLPVLKAIRAKCLDCCCCQEGEIRRCTAVYCPLWPFRMGTNPFRTPSAGAADRMRLLNARLAQSKPEIVGVRAADGGGE